MRSPINSIKKNYVAISQFGGLNHTDLTAPGEWHDMCNISNKYYPMLTPRRSREEIENIPAAANHVLYKNKLWYFTVDGEGIYCYAPDGNNPFEEHAGTTPVLIYESDREYDMVEMGNKIICIPQDRSATAISIVGSRIRKLGYDAMYSYFCRTCNPASPSVYRNVEEYIFNERSTNNAVYWLTDIGRFEVPETVVTGGRIDEHAQKLLNITFTYSTIKDDGSRYIYDNQHDRYSPNKKDFANSIYFLGTDNKFYYFNHDTGTTTEVIAPDVAIIFNLASQTYPDPDSADPEATITRTFPALEEGDYIQLQVGRSVNFKHPLYENGEDILPKQLLRVLRSGAIESGGWYTRGWNNYMIVENNAKFIDYLKKKNLFYNSVAYTFPSNSNGTPAGEVGDRGLYQLYPSYITIEHSFPVIEHPVEHNNRVWGANNENNEIKASAQGNFEVWDDYRGLVSDSYAVSVGSNDEFTASCVINDYIFFFKEHSYTMVYGNRPANFSVNTVNDFIGMNAQGKKSLQVIGQTAYYVGIDKKIYRFNGQTPVCISGPLGDVRYKVMSSAHTNNKYYLLIQPDSGDKCILVYDIHTGMWLKEDAADFEYLTCIQGKACAALQTVFLSTEQQEGQTVPVNQEGTVLLSLDKWDIPETEDNTVHWYGESGLFGLDNEYNQYFTKIKITYEAEAGSTIQIYAKYNNDIDWKPIWHEQSETKQRTRTKHIAIQRCEFVRLKICGVGFSKIYRITIVSETGGEK